MYLNGVQEAASSILVTPTKKTVLGHKIALKRSFFMLICYFLSVKTGLYPEKVVKKVVKYRRETPVKSRNYTVRHSAFGCQYRCLA